MSAQPKWSDERLGDRFREIDRRLLIVEPIVQDVIEMRVEMRSLVTGLRDNTQAHKDTAKQLEGLELEPLTRGRMVKSQLTVAIVSAFIGGALAVIATLVGSH